ncbi:MAG: CAP domain-containing protein [Planctomycetota bacterium]
MIHARSRARALLGCGLLIAVAGCADRDPSESRTQASSQAAVQSNGANGSGSQAGVPAPAAPTAPAAPAAPSARVADVGDPTPSAQAMLELINRARRDPTAEGVRLGIDLSGYTAQAPVSLNVQLTQAAAAHSQDMSTRGFFDHLNPDGVNANGRVLDSGYPLHADFGTSRTINATENIAAGTGTVLDTPEEIHAALVIDRGVAGLVHRRAILGDGPTYRSREVGLALLPGATNYTTQEFAYTRTDRPFVLGVAFQDLNGDGILNGQEGRGQVPVTLTDAQGRVVSSQTGTAGGFAFEVLTDGVFTLTVDGLSTQVTVSGESVKVDLRDGALVTY